ncbi:MAG: A24 family peptidase, partial [Pseudomonadota bacterium]
VALFYTDLTVMRLPDALTATLFAMALAAAWAAPDRTVIEAALTGGIAALILALLRWGYQRVRGVEGMGLGDVKLIAGLGALLGWQDLPLAALLAAVLALAVALLDHLRGQQSWSTSTAVPFGSYLIGATLLLLIL